MAEWILVLVLNLTGPKGEVRDLAPTVVTGFSSKAACEAASWQLAQVMIRLAGQAREQQGIQPNLSQSVPAIHSECTFVKKSV